MEELVEKARNYALAVLGDRTRSDGTPFMGHVDSVAAIARDEIGLGPESIAAVYLHEATREHPDADVSGFPPEVVRIATGLNHISKISPKDTRLEAEKYKKLIVSYSSDPRVTVLKIADRLEVMRSLPIFPRGRREQKNLETLLLYIPLAHQLGLYNIKSELEDIYFKYADPENYRAITNKLAATAPDREKLSREFIEPLKSRLDAEGIKYKLKIRTKTAYSIFRKMTVQGVPFEGVFDVFAIRFIIDCEPDRKVEQDLCWKVYSYVTEEYLPDTSRLRDWLTNPKPNGYESLHITVHGKDGGFLEVQIRTRRMDEIAESGLASHWSYKGVRSEKTLDSWLSSVRYALEHPSQVTAQDIAAAPADEVFVYTPTGELKILRSGSSVLDYAFSIHSGLGCRCIGARIDGKVVPIKHRLKTGDTVEIISSRTQRPSRDWLSFVVSSKAKSRIRRELDADERRKADEGREILQRRLKNWKMEFSRAQETELSKKLKFTGLLQFYAAIGSGELDPNTVKDFILGWSAPSEKVQVQVEAPARPVFSGSGGDDIMVINAGHVKGLDYRMASCCHPVFGDDVFGFVTRSEGIKIHRMSCPNAARLIEKYPYRIQKVVWQDSSSSGDFLSNLTVTAESDVTPQIMEVIGRLRVSLRSFSVSDRIRSGEIDFQMKLLVPSNSELDKVISLFSQLKGVLRVKRL